MSSVLHDALAAVVASFGTAQEPPSQPPEDFGVDLDCTDDLDPMFGLVSGLRVVAQAVYRRLSTPRGMLIDAPDYGFDVRSLLHRGMTPEERAAIPGMIRAEVVKDERIQSAEVQLTDVLPESFRLVVRCQTAEGPFRLTLHVSAAAVLLAEVNT